MAEIMDKSSSESQNTQQEYDIKTDEILFRDTKNKSASVFVDKSLRKQKKINRKKKDLIYETEGYKKKTFAHRMRTLGILFGLAIFTGCGLGVWYYNTMLRSNVDYETLFTKADDYLPDYNQTFNKNFSITNPTSKNWVSAAQAQGKTPANLSSIDNFVLAEWNAHHSSSFSAIGEGKVLTMGVNQIVNSAKKYDGNAYTFESVSSGVITVMSLDYYQKGSDKARIYAGNKKNNEVNWNLESEMTFSDYCDMAGNLITNIQPYIVSNNGTVVSQTETTQIEGTENYTFTLVLDNVLGVLKYAKQVKKTGGLSTYPEFERIALTVVMDRNWNFVTIDSFEFYSAVAYGMKVTCDSHLTFNYTFDGEVTLSI